MGREGSGFSSFLDVLLVEVLFQRAVKKRQVLEEGRREREVGVRGEVVERMGGEGKESGMGENVRVELGLKEGEEDVEEEDGESVYAKKRKRS